MWLMGERGHYEGGDRLDSRDQFLLTLLENEFYNGVPGIILPPLYITTSVRKYKSNLLKYRN